MKILIINYEYPPLGGGGGVFTRDLAEELARNNEVDVITSRFKGSAKEETVNGVHIYRVPVVGRTSMQTATMSSLLSFPISAIPAGAILLRRRKYDVINTHFAVPTGPAGAVLGRLSGIPNVLSLHGGDIYDPSKKLSPHRHPLLRWAVRMAINNSSAVVAQSSNTKQNAESIYRPTKNISIIPLGMPLPSPEPAERGALGLRNNALYLISVGRLVKRKGYNFLIEALGILKKSGLDAELILVGEGPEHDALASLAKNLGLSGSVKFTGAVSSEKKFRYLSASDLYVLSSLHEGFGIVLLEAMLCGLPIVATNVGGQVDIVKQGRNGLLVSPEDPAALAGEIAALIKDPDKRKAMHAANLEDVRNFSISAVAGKYEKLFSEVISRN